MPSLPSEWLETRNSPYLNQFTQPDTIIPDLSNPQSWNRYSYVTNRPVVANDPTGHYCVGDVEECVDDNEGGTGPTPPIDEEEKDNQSSNGDDALDLLMGLHPNSCTMDSCYLPPDCWNPYDDYYLCGAHTSPRWPDYYNFTIGLSFPGLGSYVSVSPTFTLDRFGNFYYGAGISFGPEAPLGIAPSLVGGWISDGPPSEERSEQFLSGMFVNVSGGAVVGGGWNWNPINGGHSWDFGLFWPQVSATIGGTTYYDAHREEPLWDP
jgi:hypothetical protein